MNNSIESIASILHKQLRGEGLTENEKKELETWVEASHFNKEVYQDTMNEQLLDEELKSFYARDKKAGWTKLRERIAGQASIVSIYPGRKKWLYIVAASFIILITGAIYFLNKNAGPKENIATENTKPGKYPNDIAPGSDGAILTLADGRQIVLDNANNGLLAQQGTSQIIKQEGQLIYDSRLKTDDAQLTYNTITTARGKQSPNLVLSDGSKAWLNSASSIRFPVAFMGSERKVEITGEVYFEVAKDASRPFRVFIVPGSEGQANTQVEVLGTQFNINAYEDEASIKTTLLEGSIKLSSGSGQSVIVKPGEQAQVSSGSTSIRVIHDIDIGQVMAWKQGLFEFNNTELITIMRQISRWYDVDIIYEGKPASVKFGGGISKRSPLSEVLNALEDAGVRFRLEGKKLYVLP